MFLGHSSPQLVESCLLTSFFASRTQPIAIFLCFGDLHSRVGQLNYQGPNPSATWGPHKHNYVILYQNWAILFFPVNPFEFWPFTDLIISRRKHAVTSQMCRGMAQCRANSKFSSDDASSLDFLDVALTLENICNKESSTKQFWQSVAKVGMLRKSTISWESLKGKQSSYLPTFLLHFSRIRTWCLSKEFEQAQNCINSWKSCFPPKLLNSQLFQYGALW